MLSAEFRGTSSLCRIARRGERGFVFPMLTFPEATGNAGFEGCCDITGEPGSFVGSNRFDVVRERAWTSPIWYESPPL